MSAFAQSPELLAKREDMCGIAAGGNKIRKLAALLGQALSQRATVVLSTGGTQSNHCALTAIAAAMHGLRAELYLSGPQPPGPAGNLLIEELAGAALTFLGDSSDRDRDDRIVARMDELRAMGEVPYLIPLGGSTPLGAAAYAAAVSEVAVQLDGQKVTHLVVAAGSLGTMAGLILGTWASGLDCQVHGYTVLWPQAEAITRLPDPRIPARRRIRRADRGRPGSGPARRPPRPAARQHLHRQSHGRAHPGNPQRNLHSPRPGRVLPHRRAGRILRSHRQRRLTAPDPGNSSTNRTQAGVSHGNAHAPANGHARRRRSRQRRTYHPARAQMRQSGCRPYRRGCARLAQDHPSHSVVLERPGRHASPTLPARIMHTLRGMSGRGWRPCRRSSLTTSPARTGLQASCLARILGFVGPSEGLLASLRILIYIPSGPSG